LSQNTLDMWAIIHNILQKEGVARQHLNSYGEFIERGLQSIIDEVGEIEIETAEYPYRIRLGKIKLQQPRIMELDGSVTHVAPVEARLRNLTYGSPIMLECSIVEDEKNLRVKIYPYWRYSSYGKVKTPVFYTTCLRRSLLSLAKIQKILVGTS